MKRFFADSALYVVLISLLVSAAIFHQQAKADSIDSLYARIADSEGESRLEAYADILSKSKELPPEELKEQIQQGSSYADSQPDSKSKARFQFKSGYVFMRLGEYQEAITYLNTSAVTYDSLGAPNLAARSYHNAGMACANAGNYDQAQGFFTKSLGKWIESDNKVKIPSGYIALGNIAYFRGNLDLALENYLLASKTSPEDTPIDIIATIYGNIASVYSQLEDHNGALEYYRKAEELLPMEDYKAFHADNYNNMGGDYEALDDLDRALEYYKKSIALYEECGLDFKTAYPTHNIGLIYMIREDYQSALHFLKLSLSKQEGLDDRYYYSHTNIEVARTYLYLSNPRSAKKYLDIGLAIAEEIGAGIALRRGYETLADYHEATGQFKQALKAQKLFKSANDSLLNEKSQQEIAQLRTKFETTQKEKEIELLQRDKQIADLTISRISTIRTILLIGFIILAGFTASLVYTHLKLRRATNELQVLSGLLPICASCKKIRDDSGYWNQLETYITDHSDARFSHGICPDCVEKLYGDFLKEKAERSSV